MNDSRSKATIRSGTITFDLEKNDANATWPQLQHVHYKDKEFKKQKREEAVLYSQQKATESREIKAREKDEQKKLNVRQQMKVSS